MAIYVTIKLDNVGARIGTPEKVVKELLKLDDKEIESGTTLEILKIEQKP